MRTFLRTLVCLLLACSTAACGLIYKPDVQQGNLLEKKDVDQLKPGMSKRQVLVLLGSPSVTSPFKHDRWDYLSTFSRRGKPANERALSLYFNNDVLVRTEGKYFEEDAAQLLKDSRKYNPTAPAKPKPPMEGSDSGSESGD